MMKPLRHIQDYLDVISNTGSRALSRACAEGNFSAPQRLTLPGGPCGWRLTISSLRGAKWSVFIYVDEAERRYRVINRRIK